MNDGIITFKDAFLICFIAIAGGILLGTVFNYFLYNIIDPGLADFIKEKSIEKTAALMERFGASQDVIEKGLADVEKQDFHMTPSKLGVTFLQGSIFGAIPALIIAAIMRTKTKPVDDIQ
jgi:hypothetical protein